ncbi:hypothetical protein EBZU44_26170 [Enterobacter cloacae]|nr:hypothetical protein EBZU44_26170 [Enterobacter cloacae]
MGKVRWRYAYLTYKIEGRPGKAKPPPGTNAQRRYTARKAISLGITSPCQYSCAATRPAS